VNFFVPTTACFSSSTEVSDSDPRIENSHPPNQPSLTPPAIGVMPFERRVEQSERSWLQVVGAEAMPALARTSLRYRIGNDGWTYHGALQSLPSQVSSDEFR
jgi:hypothetical protein